MENFIGGAASENRGPEVSCSMTQDLLAGSLTNQPRCFHYYQVTTYPFNPILADMGKFESEVCTYLNAHATGEFSDPERISDSWITEKSIGHISLLLATLAAGAHFSDMEYSPRLKITIDFGTC